MGQIYYYDTFKYLGKYSTAPVEYKKMWFHLVYSVKHNISHKYRLLADGNLTGITVEKFVFWGVLLLWCMCMCVTVLWVV